MFDGNLVLEVIRHAKLTAEQVISGIKVEASPAKWENLLLQSKIEGRLGLAVFERDVQRDILEGHVAKPGLRRQTDNRRVFRAAFCQGIVRNP